jgi:hypothetical protein
MGTHDIGGWQGIRLAMASIVSTGVSTTLVQHAAQLLIVSTTFVGGIIFLHVVGGKERGLIVSENGQREQQRIINPTRRPPVLEWAAKQILL